jgi:SpoVK/Ycf46/Vps4 family AAA+-type ATPase
VVVLCSELLRDVNLEPGALVRLSREALVALEAVARSGDEGLFLEDTPSETFADIGGLDDVTSYLRRYLHVIVTRGDLSRKYDISVKGGICLSGPPGMGKTLLARAAANFLGTTFGACRFISVKPAAHHSSYYSETERNYRELFRKAREAASREPEIPVVMFFDELDAVGGMRGTSHMRVDDRVLHAIGAELDGLTPRGNILVLSATNRPDLLDGALTRPGRFLNKVIQVPRPKRAGARAILHRHLSATVPFAAPVNGNGRDGSREESIEVLLTRIFAPNGSADLAEIVFADGARRRVRPSDLVSGAILAEIARRARETALFREADGLEEGVCGEDLLRHAEECFRERAGLLTRANVSQYIDDVGDDGSVRGVEVREFVDPAPRPVLQAALSEVA